MEENIIYSYSNSRTMRYNFIFVKEIHKTLPFLCLTLNYTHSFSKYVKKLIIYKKFINFLVYYTHLNENKIIV